MSRRAWRRDSAASQSMTAGARFWYALDCEAEALPPGERRLRKRRLEQIERYVQPIGLFGVDAQAHGRGPGRRGERIQTGQKLVEKAPPFRELQARMQGR